MKKTTEQNGKNIIKKYMNYLMTEMANANREYYIEKLPSNQMKYSNAEYDQMLEEIERIKTMYPEMNVSNSPIEEVVIQKYIDYLVSEIRKADKEYFINNIPFAPMTYTDTEYDKLHQELVELEKEYPHLRVNNSPTERIGGYTYTGFETVNHTHAMLSLEKAFNPKDLLKFDHDVKQILNTPTYSSEYKFDGLAIRLKYKNGLFVQAVTRGDGQQGDDVTEAVKTIKTIPLKLTKNIDLIVRGEILMPKDIFRELNIERKNNGEELLANVRNAAVGSLKQFDTSITAKRKLICYSFEILEGLKCETQLKMVQMLNDLGFNTIEPIIFNSMQELIDIEIERIKNIIPNLNYAIDGIAIKVNEIDSRKILGERTKSPKWAIAYKFPAEQKQTILREIKVQVGRTGALAPVASFDEIRLAGTNVIHATLHNQNFINEKDIRIGDTIIVEKSGEIIPKIISSVKEKRTGTEVAFSLPDRCPVCNSIVDKSEIVYRCQNPMCGAKIKRSLAHYISDKGIDVKGLGQSAINSLVDANIINNITDFYKLKDHKTEIVSLEGLGEKSYNNIIANIEKSKSEKMLSNFLSGLGIPLFGRRASRLVASKFLTIERLLNTTVEELSDIEGIGDIMAKQLVNFFDNNRETINTLKEYGVCMTEIVKEKKDSLEGLKFVVTGSLEKYTRKSIKSSIEENGGKVSSSISGSTDYLVCGKNAGSKLQKADT